MSDQQPQPNDEAIPEVVSQSTQVDFLLKSCLAEQEDIKDKIKEQREMLKNVLETDASYHELKDKMNELNKRRKEIVTKLSNTAAVSQVKEEMNGLRQAQKELKQKLTRYLAQYVETSGMRSFEDPKGGIRKIVTVYTLEKAGA